MIPSASVLTGGFMMSHRFLIILLIVAVADTAFSQNDPSFFKTIPPQGTSMPEWAERMYSEDPDVREVERMYHAYYKEYPFAKNTHTQNYRHWLRLLRQNHWISEDGFIRRPDFAQVERINQSWHELRKKNDALRNGQGSWSPMGPMETWDGSQWISKQVNVYTIDQSLSSPAILYCGTETGGVFKTTDKGQSWVPVGDALNIGGVGSIKVHPSDPGFVLLGQGSHIYRTLNGGETWESVFSASGLTPRDFLFLPGELPGDMVLMAATAKGLLRSTDEGQSWSYRTTASCWDIERKPFSADTVYLLQTNTSAQHIRFYRSIDRGFTFTELNAGWFAGSSAGLDNSNNGARMAVTPADPDLVYVALLGNDVSYAQDNNWIGVYRSTDAGSSWSLPAGDPGGPYSAAHPCLSSFHPTFDWGGNYDQGYYNLAIAVSSTDPQQVMVGCLNLFLSEDGGATYTGIGGYQPGISGYSHPDIQEIEINGGDVWVVTDGGVDLYAPDLSSKESLNHGINGSEYWGFGSGWNEDVLVGGRYHNGNVVLYQNYPDGICRNLGGAEASTGYVNQGLNRQVYHSDVGGKLIPEDLNGNVLNIGNLGLYPNEAISNEQSGEIEPDPRCYNHLYLTRDNELRKSTDGGTSFDLVHAFGADPGQRTTGIEISRSDPEVIYVCQRVSGSSKLWKSADGGENWAELILPATSTGGGIFISLDPEDPEHLFLAVSNGGSSTEKIFVTLNAGANWTNLTTPLLDGHWPEQVMVQGGTDGGVYLATNLGVFYRNESHSDWQVYSTGLPVKFASMSMRPFYRDAKVRIASYNRGIWSAPFFESSMPVAQPTVDKLHSSCSRDTFYFDDFSMLDHGNASWSWAFTPAPDYVSSTDVRNPKVLFGQDGSYDVSLTVTDGNGHSSMKSIAGMVSLENRCAPDTIPGLAFHSDTEQEYFVASNANLEDLTHFTVTGWWKPSGGQAGFAALFSSGDWCAHCDDTEGLIIDYFGSRVWYKWPGNAANWGENSGMVIPLDEWSYVALVIEPSGATIYLNEEKFVHAIPLDTGQIESIHIGKGHYNHAFVGEIDEVTIWKRALSEEEVRLLRHLTKEDAITADPDLIAYYQFNEEENNQVLDHAGSYHGTLVNGASLQPGTAPVGGGNSSIQDISAAGIYDFGLADLQMAFPAGGTYPGGDVVVSRLNVNPDGAGEYPGILPGSYWVVNNYGANATFSPLASIAFYDVPVGDPEQPGAYALYKRSSNAHGNDLGDIIDEGDSAMVHSLLFDDGLNLTGFSQFSLHAKTLSCLVVRDPGDSGTGTLREAIGCAQGGQYVHFSPHLAGDTVHVSSMPFVIDKDLNIIGSGKFTTYVNGQAVSRVFDVQAGIVLSIKDLTLFGGSSLTGAAIRNAGTLNLEDADIRQSPGVLAPGQTLLENVPGSTIEMSQAVRILLNGNE